MLPSLSTVIPGAFCKTSMAVPPLLTMLLSTFSTVLSNFCSIKGLLPTTVTSLSVFVEAANVIVSSCLLVSPLLTSKGLV
ncbi:hypothetical protein D3C87_1829520 [compost metagenome]